MIEPRNRPLPLLKTLTAGLAFGFLVLLGGTTSAVRAESETDAHRLSTEIDRLLAAQWPKGLQPAPRTDDAEFLRRIYLDLIGRIPQISEASDFLDNDARDKRQRLVNDLLARPDYAKHFANLWRAVLLPSQGENEFFFPRTGFQDWLQDRFQQNTGYDRIVRAILTPAGGSDRSPIAFYQLSQNKAEVLASNTARLFLGVKLECAQCHNHPHAQWTREQFWELAAFFGDGGPQANGRHDIQIPGTNKRVEARYPNGAKPTWKSDGRTTLAEWVTAPTNPYFARTAVNRLWGYFFGIGLVEPVDDAGPENLPSHPELLDTLAKQFTAHHCDVQFLIRAITGSQAYQRSSKATHPSQNEPRLFARMAVRGLSPEQLFDSLAVATDYKEPASQVRYRFSNEDIRTARSEFLARFKLQEKRTEVQTSILQALHLMNGQFMADATRLRSNEVLTTIAEAAKSNTPKKIEELYLNTLGRKPSADERARLVQYVDSGGPAKDSKKALADVFWALLNSSEFMLNH